ncbi:MAG: hypothetical protein IJV96_02560 [Clostridia bacterium]|nr:hypothetical protein [Clostridia bacterium]
MIGNYIIFGDSYSTHKDYIPSEYRCYYSDEGRGPENPVTKMRAKDTWWGRMLGRDDAHLIHNNSWSGSTVGYTGYEGDCSKTNSFIYRYHMLYASGFFDANKVDTIIVFGGTNDSWANAPLGDLQYEEWEKKDLFSVLPALTFFMDTLKRNHPGTRIIFIANCDIKPQIIEGMRIAAERIGVEYLALHHIDKMNGHPTVLGMEQIYTQLMTYLDTAAP